MALNGKETLQVLGQDANGAPAATTQQTTTGAIAALGPGGAPLANTAITTVGNGALTAAALVGGIITRTGPTGAFTDTTATAAQIITALGGAAGTGFAFEVTIKNATAFPQTLAAGANVTMSAANVVPANAAATYLVTQTGPNAVSFTHISTPLTIGVTPAQFSTGALSGATFPAGALTGAAFTVVSNTAANPGNLTTRTAAQMLADFPQARVGMSYMVRIINGQATGTATIVGDASVTVTGTATIAPNSYRDFVVTFNSATTATMQNAGGGAN